MEKYGQAVEKRMKEFYRRLSEKDRRGYAAVESDKLGHGGQEYIAELFGVDSKTIRRGLAELESIFQSRYEPEGGLRRVRLIG
jgi:NADH/NAD ratio-sensing transcriptional regulator Rex